MKNWKKIMSGIGIVAILIAVLAVTGCQGEATPATPVSETPEYLAGYTTAMLEAQELPAEIITVEVEIIKDSNETIEALSEAESKLEEMKATMSGHEDELEAWGKEDAALMLCKEYLQEDEDEEVTDLILEALSDKGWVVEDPEEELGTYRLLDNSELEVEADEDADMEELEAELFGELKVKFRDSGIDGDRHTEYLGLSCVVEDGEVSSIEFDLE